MPNVALIPGSATEIAPLSAVVDGFPELTHKLETTTGGEALEDGTDVQDHAVARQERLVLQGWVSDFNGGDRPREAWETIRRLQKSETPFAVLTEWASYREMIIRRAEAPQTARGMRFTLELEEIKRVGLTTTDLPASEVSTPAVVRETENALSATRSAVEAAPAAVGQADAFVAEARQLAMSTDWDQVADLDQQAAIEQAAGEVATESDGFLDTYQKMRGVLREIGGFASLPGIRTLPVIGDVARFANQSTRFLGSVERLSSTSTVADGLAVARNLPGLRGGAQRTVANAHRLARLAESAVRQGRRLAVAAQRTGEVDRGRVALPPAVTPNAPS